MQKQTNSERTPRNTQITHYKKTKNAPTPGAFFVAIHRQARELWRPGGVCYYWNKEFCKALFLTLYRLIISADL